MIRPALEEIDGIYGEWLWLEHTIHYERLPSYFIVLGCWSRDRGVLPVEQRDELALKHGLATPPRLAHLVPGDLGTIHALIGRSRFGASRMEGVVLREVNGPRISRLLAPDFVRKTDEAWSGKRRHNEVAEP